MRPETVVQTFREADMVGSEHLWPDPAKVQCECGALVEQIQVTSAGWVKWVCANGHCNVAEQIKRRFTADDKRRG